MAKLEAKSEVSGFVWKVETELGKRVAKGDTLIVIESMKMEIPVVAEADGVIVTIAVEEGGAVDEGKTVAVLEV
ncbi:MULTISPECIES: biotin/lipoyl-binding carrier protein [unclassified Bradyrhizobium]|uniref:biotin/lipoyl-binding carrier protein n=1 Tax=unclassified Bradyrhizobium TaxID=2631580 RepID=UPI002479AD7E|nr:MULTISPECIES: biotin/lipoyl-binding carrier protein [unclassified Bradyrhizobium]WGS18819.1 biotin/lipoyl-binding carrier protein [Bradyrhizobium sp. ISRA463]WGS25649.1 biotin/lipoyl-binding carrier protein [Bradyrhizobium sp. ISRA464]